MNEITLASANIYWYGLRPAQVVAGNSDVTFFHSALDDERLAIMLSRIDADLICFQEIVDVPRFERVLARANAKLRMRDGEGRFVTSNPVTGQPDKAQRVVFAWNPQKLSLLRWETLTLSPKWSRPHVLLTMQHEATKRQLQVLGVHAKSSVPNSAGGEGDKKRAHFGALANWVNAATAAGNLRDALILGDFNATTQGIDAQALATGALAQWAWREASGIPGELWTTLMDGVVIDHMLVSPTLAPNVTLWPEIVYFDHDPAVPGVAAGEQAHGKVLKNLTDHRPVRMKLALGSVSP